MDKRTRFYKWVKANFNFNNNGIFIRKGRPSEMINMFTVDELKLKYDRALEG